LDKGPSGGRQGVFLGVGSEGIKKKLGKGRKKKMQLPVGGGGGL